MKKGELNLKFTFYFLANYIISSIIHNVKNIEILRK
jgi:hypothetical protein